VYSPCSRNGDRIVKKLLLLSGILAPVIYVGTVILGGILRPEYSQVEQAISELVAADAPNRPLLSALFIAYNILTGAFGVGFLLHVQHSSRRKTSGIVGVVSLIAVGVIGLLLELFFPQDPGGPAVTFAGTMHIILAGVAALGSMTAIVGTGLWFKNVTALKYYTAYSLATFAIVFASGGSTPILGLTNPYFGVLERITIGSFILWLFVTAVMMSSFEGTSASRPAK
jgi:hypothetical membrane protein